MPFLSSARGAFGPQGKKVIKGPLAPVWVTAAGQVGTANLNTSVSIQLSATDDSGDAPTYSLASGSLPTGISLSSSGLLSGTLGGSAGTFTFAVNATDVNGRTTTSGSFTYLSVQPAWTFVQFTTGGNTGMNGPSLSQVASGLTSAGSSPTYSVTNGKIYLTVPATATYRITVSGARGGNNFNSSSVGGYGAIGRNDVSISQNQVLEIVVGQQGRPGTFSESSGGGGGASYVRYNGGAPIVVAGGGGGGSANQAASDSNSNTAGVAVQSNGSDQGGSSSNGSCNGTDHAGGGGGGWSSNGFGQGGCSFNTDRFGKALSGSAMGAVGASGNTGAYGGFGGGGGGGQSNGSGGGGGGYQGGAGGAYDGSTQTGGQHGSGGWGYNIATWMGTQSGDGYVRLDKL
jgi:hypothetical protein